MMISTTTSSNDDDEVNESASESEEKMPDRFNKENKPSNQQPPNRTIFIRNLPLDATKEQLEAKLKQFGRIKSCRIVCEKITNRSKGVAFCDFWDEASAKKCVDRCGDMETTITAQEMKKNKKGANLAASRRTPLLVAGRPVSIALAVSKEDAAKMMQKEAKHWKSNNKEERDRRNLYLAKEGQVHENSPAAVGVSKSDMEKRKRGDAERQARLKNPNYFISKTRLSVRNVPADFDSKLLKRAFLDATQKRASKNSTPKIVNCKLLVDASKGKGMDIEAGIQKHKGIGFVEFNTHEEAMTALRAMNNNPEVFSKQKRPIVEFAVEDARAVKKLEKRKSDRELRKKRNNSSCDDNDERPTKRRKDSIESRTFPSERVAKKVQRNLERKKLRNEQRKKAQNGDDGNGDMQNTSNEITDKFKKRKQEHAAKNTEGENNKKARKVVIASKPVATPVVIENTNKKGKHRGDKRDKTDDLIDKHINAMSSGLSNWL